MVEVRFRLWLSFTQMQSFDASQRTFVRGGSTSPIDSRRHGVFRRHGASRAAARIGPVSRRRETMLRMLEDFGMRSGASGIVLGNHLTRSGRGDEDDFAMLERLGFEVMA